MGGTRKDHGDMVRRFRTRLSEELGLYLIPLNGNSDWAGRRVAWGRGIVQFLYWKPSYATLARVSRKVQPSAARDRASPTV